ncbi:cytochrome P450 [Aspergillus minisclerotigenes]|uniref:Cytochrome P450 n=1 Tax=Aspergillus minisclerotigenes TaxID=656917 RepID=A0A5N6J763_9EURO|nr:cytochrome P450 [Aspergillus minisclerotigenes]
MYTLSTLVLLGGILGLYVLLNSKAPRAPLPPGPKGLPIIGSVGSDLPRGGKDWEHWLKHKELGIGGVILKVAYGYTVEFHDRDPLVDLVGKTAVAFGRINQPTGYLVDSIPALKYLPSWFPGAGFKKEAREYRRGFDTLLNWPFTFARRQMEDGNYEPSFVSRLIEQRGSLLSLEEEVKIKHAAAAVYQAGYDTTASTITSFFLAMALFPAAQHKAQEEIDRVVGARLPTPADRVKLPYVNALINEVLRWNPVVQIGIMHAATEDDIYEGYLIPKGAPIVPNIWAIAHDPDVYSDPMSFKPERFLASDGHPPERDPHTLVFGFGRRICPGRPLADFNNFLTIARSLAVFQVQKATKDGKEIDPIVDYQEGIVGHLSPFEVSIRPRSAEHEALIRSIEVEDSISRGDSAALESHIMRNTRRTGLNIAFVYDPKDYYESIGFSKSECADLADDVTINGVASALESLGHRVVHVPGIKTLVKHLSAEHHKQWDLVFNYSEGVFGSARESQVPALLEAYQIPFTFSDSATLATGIDKGKTKMLLEHYRIPTSPFVIVPRSGELVDYAALEDQLPYPLFAKPIAASTSNGISPSNKILRKEDLQDVVEDLRAEFKDQEILLEKFLDGREFTVAVLGSGDRARVLGVSEVTWYNPEGRKSDDLSVDFATSFSKAGRGVGHDMGHVHADPADPLVKEIAEIGLSAYQALGCKDGGRVDIRMDGAVPCVIEVNPIFGLRPDYSLFTWIAKNNGMEYQDIIAEIVDNALLRQKPVTEANGLKN